MRVLPIAYDSLGVRSTCTFVETDTTVLIDPGAALGPSRYGLPPSPPEEAALERSIRKIRTYAKKSKIITISHYHYDHYLPDENIYANKVLVIKHPTKFINKSQKERAARFLEFIDDTPERIEFVAGDKETTEQFEFGKTTMYTSPPVPHGFKPTLGYVMMCAIVFRGETFIHASDVQGPQTDEATNWIIDHNPDVLYLSGFPTVFLGWRFPKRNLVKSNENLIRILTETDVKTIILEHHLLRDLHYKQKIGPVLETAERLGKYVVTAAEFNGKEPVLLEAMRKELWEEYRKTSSTSKRSVKSVGRKKKRHRYS